MKFLHFIFLLAVAAQIGVPAILGVPMVNTELDRGIAMANVAATSQSVFYAQAEVHVEGYGQFRRGCRGDHEHRRPRLPRHALAPLAHVRMEAKRRALDETATPRVQR